MNLEVLGAGCNKCVNTADRIQEIGRTWNVDTTTAEVIDPAIMMQYSVLRPPAVAIDGHMVHSGSVPDDKSTEVWLGQCAPQSVSNRRGGALHVSENRIAHLR